MGRLQIFNNWSPYLVQNEEKTWIGLEYFCNETDALWKLSDDEMTRVRHRGDCPDRHSRRPRMSKTAHVVRVPKTYPAYFGSYDRFDVIRGYVDGFENLFLVGRNGMHKYNNQDHSMLTAMTAVENIARRHRPRTTSGPSIPRWNTTKKKRQNKDWKQGFILVTGDNRVTFGDRSTQRRAVHISQVRAVSKALRHSPRVIS